jgi:serine protease
MAFSWPGPSTRASRALLTTLLLGGLIAPPAARASGPSTDDGTSWPAYAPGHVLVHYRGTPGDRELRLPDGVSVRDAVHKLREDPGVTYANPDYLVRAAGGGCQGPNDPGHTGCWRDDQWNFLPPTSVPGGIDALGAWHNLNQKDEPGARGVTVAVLDTGVAYRRKGKRFRRDPDLPATRRFVAPKDFVGHDRLPLDQDGHGTHVASTIAESTNNHRGLTGLAYGVKVMPVRILDRREQGTTGDVARGIRYATKHGADVINLSLESKPRVRKCGQVPAICKAVSHAIAEGVVVVGAAGNQGRPRVAFPADAPGAIAVGASTYRGCLARYSDYGTGLDLLAPGGGVDQANTGNLSCNTSARGFSIRQFSLKPGPAARGNFRRFGIVGMQGTSMAAAHVSAAAALLLADGVQADGVEPRLKCTTTKPSGDPNYYGAGLLNAAQATDPNALCP